MNQVLNFIFILMSHPYSTSKHIMPKDLKVGVNYRAVNHYNYHTFRVILDPDQLDYGVIDLIRVSTGERMSMACLDDICYFQNYPQGYFIIEDK